MSKDTEEAQNGLLLCFYKVSLFLACKHSCPTGLHQTRHSWVSWADMNTPSNTHSRRWEEGQQSYFWQEKLIAQSQSAYKAWRRAAVHSHSAAQIRHQSGNLCIPDLLRLKVRMILLLQPFQNILDRFISFLN